MKLIFFLIFLIVLVHSPQQVSGECCHAVYFKWQCFPTGSSSHNGTSTKEPTERGFEIHIRDVEEYCGDCTLPTPYCGYGN